MIGRNFKRSEFECKCGCGQDTVDTEMIALCEEVRDYTGDPITPTSGNRCEAHNKAIGGSPRSQHLKGKAADLPVKDPQDVYDYLCARYFYKYGFGLYKSFIHVDCRPDKARWDGR